MNVNTKVLALVAALAAGSASAQTTSPLERTSATNAGTVITNVATATYDVPNNDGTAVSTTTTSNTVSTTVAEKMGFDITYTNGADADATDTAATAISSYQKPNVVPGSTVVFPYVAVNNGNASQSIALESATTSGVSNVVFFAANPDGNSDGLLSSTELTTAKGITGNVLTSVTVAPSGDDPATTAVETNSGMVTFYMAYDVTGNASAVVGATPIGRGKVWADTSNGGTAPGENVTVTEQKDPGSPAYDDLWYQYSSATIIAPNLTNNPQPVTTEVTPPTGTATSGYTSGTTLITVSGDQQVAYPKSDGISDTANDSVTFTNTLTNGSGTSDTVALTVEANTTTFVSGGVTYTVTQTVTSTGTAGQYTVVQTVKDPSGATVNITEVTATISTPSLLVGANSSANYTVTVSYPDQDMANPYPILLKIGADSGNDVDTTPNDFTFDTILAPAMMFGDTSGSSSDLAVATGTADTVNKLGTAGNAVTFPMDLVNPGEYADTYTLSGYTVIALTDGTKQVLAINYSGVGVTQTGTVSVTDSVSGLSAIIPVYTTGAVSANSEFGVTASVALPINVTSTAGTNYVLSQTAKAQYSGITLTDTNDSITVAAAGSLALAKFTQGTATPNEPINGITAPRAIPLPTPATRLV
ncbi:hypothetical protein ACFSC4_14505 [Deinococcus malanensis]|uniref:hypothetical protein n=1 Tax=Deinococcus malanensis TaxID=1706855 RepID=UPI00362825BC